MYVSTLERARYTADGIASSFAKFIDEIEGNYMSVIGLPIDKVYKILKENGSLEDFEIEE